MFYPAEALKRGGRFYLCWVADSWPLRFATITHRQLWSQDIRQICEDLLEVVRNESGRPKKRFSLRLSSQLLRGLVRLYQRKVIVYVGDLCMINALVMKSTNKKFNPVQVTSDPVELPRLVFEEPDDEKIEEQIQNSQNIVANVQDITLQEPTLPENRILLDDGFGELHPDQPLQLFDRTVELMRVQETSVHAHSGLDLPMDISEKSHDKSRLYTNEARIEMIPELEISDFRKSVGQTMAEPLDIDILQIPEIPPPTVPEATNDNIEERLPLEDPMHISKNIEELTLEELEPIAKKRKITKTIIDRKTQLSSNYICSRLNNINVELRCEASINDVVCLLRPAYMLLSNAARPLSAYSKALYARCIARPHRPLEHELEIPLARGTSRASNMRSRLEKIDEEVEPVEKSMDIIINIEPELPKHTDMTQEVGQLDIDISELQTQKILTESQERKRGSELEISTKRQRTSGFMSYRMSQTVADEINLEANKENISSNEQPDVQQLKAMIQAAGLEDAQQKHGSDSETPLGSLDRTKVSLGDSEQTTDSKKFMRQEWGTAATMHKIYAQCRVQSARAVTVDALLRRGPLLPGHKRLIAARLFTSILKLKQHGFIIVHKDSVTKEILNIELGEKITGRHN